MKSLKSFTINTRKFEFTPNNWSVFSCEFFVSHFTPELYDHYGINNPFKGRNVSSKRLSEYLAGRLCTQRCLKHLGEQLTPPERGIAGEPLWPPGLIGSISHTSNFAIAIVMRSENDIGVGLDVESIVNTAMADTLRNQILSPQEERLVDQVTCSNLRYEHLLTLVFCSKEAIYKAIYPTVREILDFDSAEFCDVNNQFIVFRPKNQLSQVFNKEFRFIVHYQRIGDLVVCWTNINKGEDFS